MWARQWVWFQTPVASGRLDVLLATRHMNHDSIKALIKKCPYTYMYDTRIA